VSAATTRGAYLDLVAHITEEVHLDDLMTSELVDLAALLVPAHARVLAGGVHGCGHPDLRNVLRLVKDGAATTLQQSRSSRR
jgi:hypothetical protein